MLDFLFFVLVTLFSLISFAYFLNWYYTSPSSQGATHFLVTQDGWKIAIHSYRPETPNGAPPIILCHGLTANRFIFDMQGAPSLACYLKDQGYDVWVPELRGSGMSDSPGLFSSASPYSWGYDDHLYYDVPAIIDFVTRQTGAQKVTWVGHSMGGMLIYSYVAEKKDPRVSCVVTIGSPVQFTRKSGHVFKGLLKLKFALKLLPVNPLPLFGRLLVPVIKGRRNFVNGMYCNSNIDPRVARCASTIGSQMISPSKLWLDFAGFMERNCYQSSDGVSILEKTQSLNIPLFVIAGSADEVAPLEWVIPASDVRRESGTRRLFVAGPENGLEQDYGHVDMLLGLRARTEIFPTIHSWLQQF